jgi:hypothetical protein
MKAFFQFLLLLVALLAVSISPTLAGSGSLDILSFSITCTTARVTYEATDSGGSDFADITVENLTTKDVIASTTDSPWDATVTLTYPAQPVGSVLIITVSTFTSVSSDAVAVSCVGGGEGSAAPLCPDGRINEFDCEPVAIYPVRDEDRYGIEVWIIEAEEKGIGRFGFFVSSADLDALPDNPEAPILVAESKDGFAKLYKLPTGELQVNAGPDYEGKMFVFTLEDFPNTYPTVNTYKLAE